MKEKAGIAFISLGSLRLLVELITRVGETYGVSEMNRWTRHLTWVFKG